MANYPKTGIVVQLRGLRCETGSPRLGRRRLRRFRFLFGFLVDFFFFFFFFFFVFFFSSFSFEWRAGDDDEVNNNTRSRNVHRTTTKPAERTCNIQR